jgi:hypothetical protein
MELQQFRTLSILQARFKKSLSQNFFWFFLNIVQRLGALKSKSKRQIFLPLEASIDARFTERSVFPVPPLYE